MEDLSVEELKEMKNIVAIECTWNQTNVSINYFYFYFSIYFITDIIYFIKGNFKSLKKYKEKLQIYPVEQL